MIQLEKQFDSLSLDETELINLKKTISLIRYQDLYSLKTETQAKTNMYNKLFQYLFDVTLANRNSNGQGRAIKQFQDFYNFVETIDHEKLFRFIDLLTHIQKEKTNDFFLKDVKTIESILLKILEMKNEKV